VWKLYATGNSQGEIIRHLSKLEITPAVPARYPGKDTIRDMVRVVTQQLPRRRDELRSNGLMEYDIPDRLAREFDVDRRVIDQVLLRLMKTPGEVD